MKTPESDQRPELSSERSTPPGGATPKTRKKRSKWDRPAKALVLCLGLVFCGWLAWQFSIVREMGVPWLAKLGTPAVPMLRHALQDDDKRVRSVAAEALQRLGPAAVPSLVEGLTDQSARVRAEAALALGVLHADGREAGPHLVRALTDADARVRGAAARALGRVDPKAKDALPLLAELVKDADPTVRADATEAMSIIGREDMTVLGLLLELIKDPHHGVRLQAVEGLAKAEVTDARIRPALTEAANNDSDPGVRREAKEALTERDEHDKAGQENK